MAAALKRDRAAADHAGLQSSALVSLFFPNFLYHRPMTARALSARSIDVLKRSAPVALLASGMTLVIATRGIDLSVGTVMAIAGAVAAAWDHIRLRPAGEH
jgi:ribose/xylose/arabinose/galactoside ABC-type transport system permease subunit